jgi:hypothetical protein
VVRVLIGKRFAAGSARLGARLDVPVVHNNLNGAAMPLALLATIEQHQPQFHEGEIRRQTGKLGPRRCAARFFSRASRTLS